MAMIALTAVLGLFSIIGAIFVATFSRILADDCKAWSPWLVERLIRRAVHKLPADMQERFQEEWQSHIQEIPGEIGKLVTALGFQVAASRASNPISRTDRLYAAIIIVFIAPLFTVIAAWIKIHGGSRVFVRVKANKHHVGNKSGYVFMFDTSNKAGNSLRKYGFHELPFLLDIVRGDGSIGPIFNNWKEDLIWLKNRLGL